MITVIYDNVLFFVFAIIILAHSTIVHCLKLALFKVAIIYQFHFVKIKKIKFCSKLVKIAYSKSCDFLMPDFFTFCNKNTLNKIDKRCQLSIKIILV